MERISEIIELDTVNSSKNFPTIENLPNPSKDTPLLRKKASSKKKAQDIPASIEPALIEDPDSFFSLEKIMTDVQADLKTLINEKIYKSWFSGLKLIAIAPVLNDAGGFLNIVVGCVNKFSLDHLKHQYSTTLEASFKKVTGSDVVLKFETIKESDRTEESREEKEGERNLENKNSSLYNPKVISKNTNGSAQNASSLRGNQNRELQRGTSVTVGGRTIKQPNCESNLNYSYNFSNFVVGACNQFAQAACIKVSESPGVAYNPLLIYGGVGLGKTHLANAIGNAARRRNKKVLLASSERFVSELISSLRSNTMDKFKAKFRSLDVLIIDDIQFIIGKERTQEEFFHTFNELYGQQKQIIITSDKLPQDLVGLEERLRTRFSSGLSVDLQAPDFETRIAILIKKAESVNLNLSYDIAKILAERINTNVRELEGALTRLQALCSLFNQNPSVEIAKRVVDTISPVRTKEITTDGIKEAVAKQFNVSIHDLSGKRRTQNIALARQVAMYLCRKHVSRSFPEIGAIFGGRDHSTVIHAIKTMNDRIVTDKDLQQNIESITQNLNGA